MDKAEKIEALRSAAAKFGPLVRKPDGPEDRSKFPVPAPAPVGSDIGHNTRPSLCKK